MVAIFFQVAGVIFISAIVLLAAINALGLMPLLAWLDDEGMGIGIGWSDEDNGESRFGD